MVKAAKGMRSLGLPGGVAWGRGPMLSHHFSVPVGSRELLGTHDVQLPQYLTFRDTLGAHTLCQEG